MNTDEYVLAAKVEALENRVENESRNTLGYLLSLQNKLDELEKRVREVEIDLAQGQPSPQSVADFERSQSLNDLNQNRTTNRDIDYEALTKAAQQYNADWTDLNPVSDRIRIQAFKAGAEWCFYKPLPNPTL